MYLLPALSVPFLTVCRLRKDFQELFLENAEFLEEMFCSNLAPRGRSASWRTPCAMDISLFLQKNTPKQLATTIYNLPRLGTTTGVPGTELFGEEWANQLVSQCLLPHDVSLALEAPLRQPLSASIGRRTSVIPGVRSHVRNNVAYTIIHNRVIAAYTLMQVF